MDCVRSCVCGLIFAEAESQIQRFPDSQHIQQAETSIPQSGDGFCVDIALLPDVAVSASLPSPRAQEAYSESTGRN